MLYCPAGKNNILLDLASVRVLAVPIVLAAAQIDLAAVLVQNFVVRSLVGPVAVILTLAVLIRSPEIHPAGLAVGQNLVGLGFPDFHQSFVVDLAALADPSNLQGIVCSQPHWDSRDPVLVLSRKLQSPLGIVVFGLVLLGVNARKKRSLGAMMKKSDR